MPRSPIYPGRKQLDLSRGIYFPGVTPQTTHLNPQEAFQNLETELSRQGHRNDEYGVTVRKQALAYMAEQAKLESLALRGDVNARRILQLQLARTKREEQIQDRRARGKPIKVLQAGLANIVQEIQIRKQDIGLPIGLKPLWEQEHQAHKKRENWHATFDMKKVQDAVTTGQTEVSTRAGGRWKTGDAVTRWLNAYGFGLPADNSVADSATYLVTGFGEIDDAMSTAVRQAGSGQKVWPKSSRETDPRKAAALDAGLADLPKSFLGSVFESMGVTPEDSDEILKQSHGVQFLNMLWNYGRYSIPGIGQASIAHDALALGGSIQQQGVRKTLEGIVESLNPLAENIPVEERIARSLILVMAATSGLAKAKIKVNDWSIKRKLREIPGVTKEDAQAALHFTREAYLRDQVRVNGPLKGKILNAFIQLDKRVIEHAADWYIKRTHKSKWSDVHESHPPEPSAALKDTRVGVVKESPSTPYLTSKGRTKELGPSTSTALGQSEWSQDRNEPKLSESVIQGPWIWKRGADDFSELNADEVRDRITKKNIDDILEQGPIKVYSTGIDPAGLVYKDATRNIVVPLDGMRRSLEDGFYGRVGITNKRSQDTGRILRGVGNSGGVFTYHLHSPKNIFRSNGLNLLDAYFASYLAAGLPQNELKDGINEALRRLRSGRITSPEDLVAYLRTRSMKRQGEVAEMLFDRLPMFPNANDIAIKAVDPAFRNRVFGDIGGIGFIDLTSTPQDLMEVLGRRGPVYGNFAKGLNFGFAPEAKELAVPAKDLFPESYGEFEKMALDKFSVHYGKGFDPTQGQLESILGAWLRYIDYNGIAHEPALGKFRGLSGSKFGVRRADGSQFGGRLAAYGLGNESFLQQFEARSSSESGTNDGGRLPWEAAGGHEFVRGDGDRERGGNASRTRVASRRRNVGGYTGRNSSFNSIAAPISPVSVIPSHIQDVLYAGLGSLRQAHGLPITRVVADDISWHPAAAAQAMADLASGDKRFREALADNGHEPDRFAAMLRSGAAGSNLAKTALVQLAEIYA